MARTTLVQRPGCRSNDDIRWARRRTGIHRALPARSATTATSTGYPFPPVNDGETAELLLVPSITTTVVDVVLEPDLGSSLIMVVVTSTERRSKLSVKRLGPALGAEVAGVDLARVDDETWREIEALWAEHLVLFFRDQNLEPEAHETLGRRIGELHVHPAAPTVRGHPHVMIIHADENSKYVAGNGWHTDVSCDERPPAATILHLPEIPELGGDTLFISTEAAYEALSQSIKDFLADKAAVHESTHVYAGRYGSKESESRDGTFPRAVHPVIRTHPVTGRKALYVNRAFTTRIKGLAPNESRAILGMLCDHIEHRPEFQCRFTWTPGAVAMWDNRNTQHYAAWDYFPQRRSGRRVSVVGERPF